jgi:hypothetical protein
MSIGIAAPASSWYLKGLPISDIALVVDYIVYMTYDLHGQWDYGKLLFPRKLNPFIIFLSPVKSDSFQICGTC